MSTLSKGCFLQKYMYIHRWILTRVTLLSAQWVPCSSSSSFVRWRPGSWKTWDITDSSSDENLGYLLHIADYTIRFHREYFIGYCKDPNKPTSISRNVTRVLNAQLSLISHDWINWKPWIAKLCYSIREIQWPAGSSFRDKRLSRKKRKPHNDFLEFWVNVPLERMI